MKNVINQKWVLSAFLIAALGSQYYFSTSSNSMSETELASTAPAPAPKATVDDATQILARASAAGASGTVSATPGVSTTVTARPATESSASTTDCADCIRLSRADAEKIRSVLAEVAASRTTTSSPAATTPANPLADCANEATQADKLKCERQAREDARRDAADLKKEKDLDARLARNEDFLDKMDDAADKCRGDLDCITSRYTSLLSRYTGSRKIDVSVAQSAYKKYIEPALKSRLASMDGTSDSANDIISALASGVPSEYNAVKQQMTLAIKQSADARIAAVKEDYRQSKVALDNRNPAESMRLMQQAQAEQAQVSVDFFGNPQMGHDGYFDVLSADLKDSDSSTWSYVQSNLISPVKNLFSSINNPTSSTFNNGNTNGNNSDRNNIRGASTTGSTVGTRGSTLNNSMSTMPTLPSTNNGVIFQQPTSTLRGNRGSR